VPEIVWRSPKLDEGNQKLDGGVRKPDGGRQRMDGGKQEKDWCVNVGVTVCVRVCVFVGVFWFKVIVWLCVQVSCRWLGSCK